MSQYTMLGGYKIDVETEPYDKGSFDTDYSKAIQLTIRLSANNSHKEKMECYFIQANDYATFYDICDSVDGDMLDMCYDVKKYIQNAHQVFFNNNQIGMIEPQFDGMYHMLLIDVIEQEFGYRPDVIASFMHKDTWDEMQYLLECAGYRRLENKNLCEEIVQVILVNDKETSESDEEVERFEGIKKH